MGGRRDARALTAPPAPTATPPSQRHLVLLGAGHAQLAVLRSLARHPLPSGVRATLVTPSSRFLYSGMLPGVVAGHYRLEQCEVPLGPLVQAARIEARAGEAVALDAARRRLTLADGSTLGYDWLSIDTGGVMSRHAIAGSAEHGVFVRPLERFAALWDALRRRSEERFLCVVVVGGGAAGFELALAARHALGERGHVSLVAGGVPLLAGHAPAARRRAHDALERHGVQLFREACTELRPGQVVLEGGLRLACDAPLLAIGVSAPAWLAGSGLALDAQGYVATGASLQSVSHPEVFAAGDVASRTDEPRPKSGVQAVRAGPVLAANLRRALDGRPLARHHSRAWALALLACGERRAIASWGPFAWQGRHVWHWKDRIDRRFVAKYRRAG